LGSKQQFGFSLDVVVLEITGPNVTNLTLVDLPGIISNAGPEGNEEDVLLIENMVRSYIKHGCVILLVLTMTGMLLLHGPADRLDDIQNQKAARFAREADPMGTRTIGVLTKADMLDDPVDLERWLDVVRNDEKTLRHGYYVSMRP
jgi:hypothetical protein